jgi:8-oxo-dGTP diphosphatase
MYHLILPSINIFFIKGKKVLLGKRINTGWMDGYLCPPGGHIEAGETPILAAIREVKEELGIDIKPTDLEFICVAARNTSPTEYVAYEFSVKDKNFEFTNNELEKCSELVWVDIDNLPDNVISDFREIIERSILGHEKYLEIGYS